MLKPTEEPLRGPLPPIKITCTLLFGEESKRAYLERRVWPVFRVPGDAAAAMEIPFEVP